MSNIQGYDKKRRVTTLNVFRDTKDKISLVWDKPSQTFFIYENDRFVRSIAGYNGEYEAGTISVYSPSAKYYSGSTFVSYVNSSSIDPQFQKEAIYRCIIDANVGESPEGSPVKWIIQSSSGNGDDLTNIEGGNAGSNYTVNIDGGNA